MALTDGFGNSNLLPIVKVLCTSIDEIIGFIGMDRKRELAAITSLDSDPAEEMLAYSRAMRPLHSEAARNLLREFSDAVNALYDNMKHSGNTIQSYVATAMFRREMLQYVWREIILPNYAHLIPVQNNHEISPSPSLS